ncbi:MAG: hypothetical protein ACK4UT_06635 [Moraxellaceae bacterium]
MPPPEDDLHDAALRARYRALAPETPAPATDAAILAAARAAAGKPTRWRQRRWLGGLATAASLLLVVALLLQSQHRGELHGELALTPPPMPAAETAPSASAPATNPAPAPVITQERQREPAVAVSRPPLAAAPATVDDAATPPSSPPPSPATASDGPPSADVATSAERHAIAAPRPAVEATESALRADQGAAPPPAAAPALRAGARPAPSLLPDEAAYQRALQAGDYAAALRRLPEAADREAERDLLRQLLTPGAPLRCHGMPAPASAQALCRLLQHHAAGHALDEAAVADWIETLRQEGRDSAALVQALRRLPPP